MKFSDIEAASWKELQPYVDTCILPITGLNGEEMPWEATEALEALRDALDCLEIPYKGRVLTYPAFHYAAGSIGQELLCQIYSKLKATYRYVVLVSFKEEAGSVAEACQADISFVLTPVALAETNSSVRREVAARLQQLWASR